MTLNELAHDVKAIQAEAKMRWGGNLVCNSSGKPVQKHGNHYDCEWCDQCYAVPNYERMLEHMITSDNAIKFLKESDEKEE